MALDPIQGNQKSSRVDLGCMEHFSCCCSDLSVPLDCDGVLGDSLEFHQGRQGSFLVLCRTRNWSAGNAGELGLI